MHCLRDVSSIVFREADRDARDANDFVEKIFEATKQDAANAQQHFNWSLTPPPRRRQQ